MLADGIYFGVMNYESMRAPKKLFDNMSSFCFTGCQLGRMLFNTL